MEGAMTNLRGIHVLSVRKHEEEMSRFQVGLCDLTAKGFKRIPSYSTFVLPHFMSIPTKKRWNTLAGDRLVFVSFLSVSVMQIEYTYTHKMHVHSPPLVSQKPVKR